MFLWDNEESVSFPMLEESNQKDIGTPLHLPNP
jgi:hypothetical protein